MSHAALYVGDVRQVLRSFPVRHFRSCVTSPPYWGLRSYGTEPQVWGGDPTHAHEWTLGGGRLIETTPRNGKWTQAANGDELNGAPSQGRFKGNVKAAEAGRTWEKLPPDTCVCGAWRGELGLEPTMELYIQHIVEVLREVRRVLTDDGTLWLNLGDSYTDGGRVREASVTKLRPKNLLMVPARVAIALQADGWYLRSEIIWSKPNVMPESVRDRPTRSHEKLYLLSKQERYFYDAVAIEEPQNQHERARRLREQREGLDTVYDLKRDEAHGQAAPGATGVARSVKARQELALKGTRNARDVWVIPTSPAPIAHFATFPEELARRCILAGSSARGRCPNCGEPWARVSERRQAPGRVSGNLERRIPEKDDPRGIPADDLGRGFPWSPSAAETVAWKPTCTCTAADQYEPIPDRVLDPFGGSGTTAFVATNLGRDATHIDLNPTYTKLAQERIGPMLCEVVA